jgi:hypothetical protein
MTVEAMGFSTNRTEEHPMEITEAARICTDGGETGPAVHYKAPYDQAALQELEQMIDRGDAQLEALPESWAYTHRLMVHTGARWLVFIRENSGK